MVSNPSSAFHQYAMEWEPGQVRWYIDGSLKKTHSGSDVTSMAMQLYINVALGGSWPGPVDSATAFPQTMLVDYVRVYKKQSVSPNSILSVKPAAAKGTAAVQLKYLGSLASDESLVQQWTETGAAGTALEVAFSDGKNHVLRFDPYGLDYGEQILVYDADDLITNSARPTGAAPSAVWEVDLAFKDIRGISYDPVTRRLYLATVDGDGRPVIRVYQTQ
jgi:beta-glucanase (GH16 family)